ncbi:pentapeptide repeat-containing protein [Streptomyces sp. NPDC051362]|uniref:pentapeptide repeat-containing protein n=1 Tax=Streptomyces sp. NPDC051362 TaxID=3365651 RepID=UPI00379E95A9
MSTSSTPSWPYCANGADTAADPVGCRGSHVPGHTACLAHLADTERNDYLRGLTPGTDIDHRGTPFTESLLSDLLTALHDPATGHARLGHARFDSATFQGNADFDSATFEGWTSFTSATFHGVTGFTQATFHGGGRFQSATFEGFTTFSSAIFGSSTVFDAAVFHTGAAFTETTFRGDARFESATFQFGVFESATFHGDAEFQSVTFEGEAAVFQSATFHGGAGFQSVTFEGDAMFGTATFEGDAKFASAEFRSVAGFGSATFEGNAEFGSAIFHRVAGFRSAAFLGDARFDSVAFQGAAWFNAATFQATAVFQAATFRNDANFASADFEQAPNLGPLACAGRVVLSGARFGGPVTLSLSTRQVACRRTRWSSTAELRLRYSTVDFAHAVFEYPLTIAAEADPFVLDNGQLLAEDLLLGEPDTMVRVVSLRGVDAAHLVLADVDLSGCLFTGTVHLDQLRLEGACTFDTAPAPTWQGWRPVRFTQRRILAEEHHWRARQPEAVRGWNVAVLGAGHAGPLQLAPVYRALRKAFEDGKHEPGAADFYYGEMEMRRHATDIPPSERRLLTAYWALSGYGMRASRALTWLGTAMVITIVLLMGLGLPRGDPKQEATGIVPAGRGRVTFEIGKNDPLNPTGNRYTGERFEKALNVTLNSVVFRSADQDLTTAGTYIEMTSRLLEPALLALAVLAIRGRIKR